MATKEEHINIGTFEATSVSEAVSHLKRFELLCEVKKWTEPKEIVSRFRLTLGVSASLWDSTLNENDLKDFDTYKAAFTKFFIKSNSSIVAQQELSTFNLENFKTVNELYHAILAKGQEAGQLGEALATPFLSALPHEMRQFCLGTDDPNLANFVKRANIFAATSSTKKPTSSVNPVLDDKIVALTKEVDRLKADRHASRGRQRNFNPRRWDNSPRRRPNYRTPSPRRSPSPRRPPQNRYRSPSPNRNRFRKPLQCYNCQKYGHTAKMCWHRKN